MERAIEVAGASPVQIIPQVAGEAQVIELWIQQNDSPNTRRSYTRTAKEFLSFVGKPLVQVSRADLQDYKNSLIESGLKPASVNQHLATVKSLLTYTHDIGYTPFNVGRAVKLLKQRDDLAARILEQPDMLKIIALEQNTRNHAMLTLLYYSGARVSEICALKWGDLKPREKAGQVTLYGKGGKTRTVKLPTRAWSLVKGLRKKAENNSPVFPSARGGRLDPSQVFRIVKAAAIRAGVEGNVSPHWFRHGHASHALDAGCPVHVLKESLGHASLATTSRYTHARPTESSSDYLK
jgi:integrase/recombinase XerD